MIAQFSRGGSWRAKIVFATAAIATVVWGHENTLHRFERSLDPRETALLARADSARNPPAAEKPAGASCRLTVRLVDAESKQPIPGMIRIRSADGGPLLLSGLLNRGLKLRTNSPAKSWHVLPEPGEVLVPQEQLIIDGISGLETETATRSLDLRGRDVATVELPLTRFFDAKSNGWRSGNPHLHVRGMSRMQADEYLRTIPVGDGLEVVFVTYASRPGADADYISNEYTRDTLQKLASTRLQFGHGQEHRNNFGSGGQGYGHVLLLDLPHLIQPVSIGPGIGETPMDFPPLRRGIDRARELSATIVWCHNSFGFEHIPSWLSGRVHAHNIFDGGTQGSYDQTFYRFLNLGLKVPFSTGTDWFIYDFSRVYVRLPGTLDVETWCRGLEEGRTFITNGPLLEFEVDGRAIGDSVVLERPGQVRVKARAIGRADFAGLEVVHDGRIVATAPSRRIGGHFLAEIETPIVAQNSGWVAARIPGGSLDTAGVAALPQNLPFRPTGSGQNEFGEALFAHTSPVYLEVGNGEKFDGDAARELIHEMEQAIKAIQAAGRFDSDHQRQEVLGIYRDAIGKLKERLR